MTAAASYGRVYFTGLTHVKNNRLATWHLYNSYRWFELRLAQKAEHMNHAAQKGGPYNICCAWRIEFEWGVHLRIIYNYTESI